MGGIERRGRGVSDPAKVAARNLKAWRENPVQYAARQFRFDPDPWQADVFRAFADQATPRIAMQSCIGPGKTATLAILALNFLSTYATADDFPNVAVMSVTADNLRNNFWKELAVWRDKSDFLRSEFEMTSERIFHRRHPSTWFLAARSWSKTANADAQGRTLSGLHAKYIAYFIDESGDIAPAVLRAAEQGLSNCVVGKIVQAGNPTSHEGMLYFAAKEQPEAWHIVQITGDPDDPKRSPRVSLDWARYYIGKYGRANPWVMAYILGRFPATSINALLGPDDVRAAMQRELKPDHYTFSQKRLGIDIARFGDDATVLFPRQGLASFPLVEMRDANSLEVSARIALARQRWRFELGLIDTT